MEEPLPADRMDATGRRFLRWGIAAAVAAALPMRPGRRRLERQASAVLRQTCTRRDADGPVTLPTAPISTTRSRTSTTLLRDFRTGRNVHPIDLRLLDRAVYAAAPGQQPIAFPGHLRLSLACDQCQAGVAERRRRAQQLSHQGDGHRYRAHRPTLPALHRAALSLQAGGVGFYPKPGFVHVDVGPVRTW